MGGVNAEWAANAPAGYAVETSKDGLFWDRTTTHEVAGPGFDKVIFPTTEARFIRLAGLAPAGSSADRAATGNVGAWSVGVEGITNIAIGATATASGNEDPTLTASQAFDGNLATRWSANYNGVRWIAGDLGKVQPVNEVTIAWEGASAKDYTVSTSLDGVTWTVAATKTAMPENKRTDVVAFESVNTRHIKVEVQSSTLGIYLSAYEIEARNTAVMSLGVAGSLAGEPNEDGTFDAEPTVTLAATGAGAQGASLEYRIGQGPWTAYAAPFEVAGYQLTTVEYRAGSGAETFAGYLVLDLDTPGASPSPTPEPTGTAAPPAMESTTPAGTAPATTPAAGGPAASQAATPAAAGGGLASTGAGITAVAMAGMLLTGAGALTLLRRRSSRGRYQS